MPLGPPPLPPMAGGGMLALEAGSFEITTAFAGALGKVAVSAHAALLGICTYTFISFPFAIATAATIRVGNLLGAGQARQVCMACGVWRAACGRPAPDTASCHMAQGAGLLDAGGREMRAVVQASWPAA